MFQGEKNLLSLGVKVCIGQIFGFFDLLAVLYELEVGLHLECHLVIKLFFLEEGADAVLLA